MSFESETLEFSATLKSEGAEVGRKGSIYLVATPIGNLDDITLRALNVLRDVDLVAAEDTRRTGMLLAHYDMKKKLVSYHEHNERSRANEIVRMAEEGMNIAVVSDAGTPAISDPGCAVVKSAIDAGIDVVPVPGPTAFVSALITSGLSTDEFTFIGFLPRKSTKRRAKLELIKNMGTTLIFYESPHRLAEMMEDALSVLGDRACCVTREITKKFEEIKRGKISEVLQCIKEGEPRGEYVILVDGIFENDTQTDDEGRPVRRSHENKYAKYSKYDDK